MKNCPKCAAKKKTTDNPSSAAEAEINIESILDSVKYQPETIVSREVIHQKNGTVTIFAFDQGQGLSEHTAPFDALVQVLEGTVEIRIDGKPHKLKAGQMMIMPEDHPHALTALTRFKMLLVMIKSKQ